MSEWPVTMVIYIDEIICQHTPIPKRLELFVQSESQLDTKKCDNTRGLIFIWRGTKKHDALRNGREKITFIFLVTKSTMLTSIEVEFIYSVLVFRVFFFFVRKHFLHTCILTYLPIAHTLRSLLVLMLIWTNVNESKRYGSFF